VDFRSRLLATLRAIEPVLAVEGVMVVGSELPNLLQPDAASTLVVSQDVDVAVPLQVIERVKAALRRIEGLRPSEEEPSVWVPLTADLLEVKFLGLDPSLRDPTEVQVKEDDELPLLVFGTLSLLRPDVPLTIGGLSIPRPRTAGLLLEKLLTDRSGVKGDRDLLVAAGLLALADDAQLDELSDSVRALAPELRHAVVANLAILSLMEPIADMPDPRRVRPAVTSLLQRLDDEERA
jgi:hypothetical protein